jgi:hypothetical protein
VGLLGKLFGGSGKKEPQRGSSRSKRGRAPSIRQPLPEGSAPEPEVPIPEISLDEIEAQQAPRGRAPQADQPIPVEMPPAPPPAGARPQPPAGARPPAKPQKRAPTRKTVAPGSPGPRAVRRSTRVQSRQKPLGEILIASEAISTEQLTRALKIQDKGGKGLIGQILISIGACSDVDVSQALSRQFRISTVEMERIEIPAEVAGLVSQEVCQEHRLIPFEKLGKTLCLAMANCLNRKAINQIEEDTKLKVKPFNCSWIEIREAIQRVYAEGQVKAAPGEAKAAQAAAETEAVAAELEASGSDDELRPFTGQAKAVIEGLEDLDAGEAEVVATTERGLASRHLKKRQARREERAKVMGTGKGVVGKLIAPDLDKFFGGVPEVIDLRQVDDDEVGDAELPIAEELAASVAAFAEQAAPAAPPEEAEAPEAAAEPEVEAKPAPVAAAEEDEYELLPAHGAGAEYAAEPQVETIAAAEAVAEELQPAAALYKLTEADGVLISDEEWAGMEADLELDPVVAWEATYACAGPVTARESMI